MNILVTGAGGQLGYELKKIATESNNTYKFHFTTRQTLDITNIDALKVYCSTYDINIIINTAAYTAVDRAETNVEQCNLINYEGVKNLVLICQSFGLHLIHISTDYVFDGRQVIPYKETDICNPLGVYGSSKYKAEKFIIANLNALHFYIIRTSWLYSTHGSNFVKTMLHLANERDTISVVHDQIGCPTYAYDLAQAIFYIIHTDKFTHNGGIYHFSNEGFCSWYEFAKEIFRISNKKINVLPISSAQYPTLAQRPSYTVFDKSKFKHTFAYNIRIWQEALQKMLEIL